MRGILITFLGKVRQHKMLTSVAAGAILLCVVILLVVGDAKKPVQAAPQPLAVEVVQVEQKDVPLYSEWIGTTDGMVNADVRAQVSGYLLKMDYTEGAFVKQGQLLFEIDPRPFQAVLNQAKGDLAKSESQVQQAITQLAQAEANLGQMKSQLLQFEANQRKTQLDVDKFGPLLAKKAVTQQDFDNANQTNEAAKAQIEVGKSQIKAAASAVETAKAAIVAAKAQVQSSQAMVKTAELNLGFTKIISPIDGIVGIALAQVGDLVNPTSGIITTVSTVDPIKVYFTVGEQQYLDFISRYATPAERDAALQDLGLELFLSNGTTYPEKGKFYVADRQVDQKTGAIRLAGIFANPGNTLRPGQYARVRAVTSTQKDALLIPQRAVIELQGTYRVSVVGNDNKVSIRPVTLGPQVGSMWIIQDGLKPRETVVVMGTQRLTPGQLVSPKPYTASATAQQQ